MYNNNMYLDNDCILVCFKPLDPLTSFLNSEGRMIYRVLADGNCMFHALSHQLFGSPNKDFDVRSLLVRFESKNRSIFSSLLTSLNEPDINSHIRKMLAPGVWGTHVELVAAATYFQIPAYILKNNRCSWKFFFLWALNVSLNTSFAQKSMLKLTIFTDHIILNYSIVTTATMIA